MGCSGWQTYIHTAGVIGKAMPSPHLQSTTLTLSPWYAYNTNHIHRVVLYMHSISVHGMIVHGAANTVCKNIS